MGNISKNKQKNVFENLKSDFILKKVFSIMKLNKSLEIMKYNKKLQKRLNININDYRECSKIEIELKLADREYGKFINPLASPSAGAPALKYGDVNTETTSPGEVKGLIF